MARSGGPGRGGYRQPAKPAPVSAPGAGSARTDGGPGSTRQPIRVAPGQSYGDRAASEQQQAALPLPDTTGLPVAPGRAGQPQGGAGAPTPVGAGLEGGAFGPTQRPMEPMMPEAPAMLPGNPDGLIALLYKASGGDPAIGRLLRGNQEVEDRSANGL